MSRPYQTESAFVQTFVASSPETHPMISPSPFWTCLISVWHLSLDRVKSASRENFTCWAPIGQLLRNYLKIFEKLFHKYVVMFELNLVDPPQKEGKEEFIQEQWSHIPRETQTRRRLGIFTLCSGGTTTQLHCGYRLLCF